MRLIFLVMLSGTGSLALATPPCDDTGAFGFKFGDKLPPKARRLHGGNASEWFSVAAPAPSIHFDDYEIRIDTKTRGIFEVVAKKRVNFPERWPDGLPEAEQEAGRARSNQVMRDYFASIGEDLNADYESSYGRNAWERTLGDVLIKVTGDDEWEAWLSCKSIPLENELARRVMPELFGTEKQKP